MIAVNQWGSLIAVDYNCRPFGVKRGMTVEEATKLCPQLECVHVEVITVTKVSVVFLQFVIVTSTPKTLDRASGKVSLRVIDARPSRCSQYSKSLRRNSEVLCSG